MSISRVFGAFDNRDPILMLRDPQLIKHVMVKDFDHFVNRRNIFAGDKNLFNSSLLLMENDEWRDMRNTLTPAFTGSKMRQMFQLILTSLDEAMVYLKDCEKEVPNVSEGFELDVKDFTTRLTNGIIATTAFGLQVNSYREQDNEFYQRAKAAVTLTSFQQMKAMFVMFLPKVAKVINLFKILNPLLTNIFLTPPKE